MNKEIDYFAPRCGKNNTDREIPALRRTDTGGRSSEKQQNQKNCHFRLDGHRKATWYLGFYICHGV